MWCSEVEVHVKADRIRCLTISVLFWSKNELIFGSSRYFSGMSSLVTDDDSPKYFIVSCLDVFLTLSHVLFTK